MSSMKRLVSLLLAATLTFTSVQVPTFANEITVDNQFNNTSPNSDNPTNNLASNPTGDLTNSPSPTSDITSSNPSINGSGSSNPNEPNSSITNPNSSGTTTTPDSSINSGLSNNSTDNNSSNNPATSNPTNPTTPDITITDTTNSNLLLAGQNPEDPDAENPDDVPEAEDEEPETYFLGTITEVNPIYESQHIAELDAEIEEYAELLEEYADVSLMDASRQTAFTPAEAAEISRDEMIARAAEYSYTIKYTTLPDFIWYDAELKDYVTNKAKFTDYVESIRDEAFKYNPTDENRFKGGDYLRYSFYGGATSLKLGKSATGEYYLTFTAIPVYFTDADQEAYVDEEIPKILQDLRISYKAPNKKITAIYEYITNKVMYAHEAANYVTGNGGDFLSTDPKFNEYRTVWSAYGALHDEEAVCQGYSALMYRLLQESGIQCRIISGTAFPYTKKEGHAWNIIELDGKFYNADSTWDAKTTSDGVAKKKYFMKSPTSFKDPDEHKRSDEYETEAFRLAYPMSLTDYDPANYIADCTRNFINPSTNFANVVVFAYFEDDLRGEEYFKKRTNKLLDLYNGVDETSVYNYLDTISYGQFKIGNIFPQYDGEEIIALKLNGITHNECLSGNRDDSVIEQIRTYLDSRKLSSSILDYNGDGIVDNLTVILHGGTSTVGSNSTLVSHAANYGSDGKISSKRLLAYNIINTYSLLAETVTESEIPAEYSWDVSAGESTLICHEFLHTLGFPDLYSSSSLTEPVGIWDIMSKVSNNNTWPLAITRQKFGNWVTLDEVNENARLTLDLQSKADGHGAYILRSPLCESEYFVIEYRKKSSGLNKIDYALQSSGLIVYRVNEAVAGLSNNYNGETGIYVFRPDTGNARQDLNGAALYGNGGRSQFGSADLTETNPAVALTFSDGRNSGIVLKNVSDNTEDQITVDVEFPINPDIWFDTKFPSQVSETPGTSGSFGERNTQIGITSFGDVQYAALLEDSAINTYKYEKNQWTKVGAAIAVSNKNYVSNLDISAVSGSMYLAFADAAGLKIYRWNGSGWKLIGSKSECNGDFNLSNVSGIPYVTYIDTGYSCHLLRISGDVIYDKGIYYTGLCGQPKVAKYGNNIYTFVRSASDNVYMYRYNGTNNSYTEVKVFDNSNVYDVAAFDSKLAVVTNASSVGSTFTLHLYDGTDFEDIYTAISGFATELFGKGGNLFFMSSDASAGGRTILYSYDAQNKNFVPISEPIDSGAISISASAASGAIYAAIIRKYDNKAVVKYHLANVSDVEIEEWEEKDSKDILDTKTVHVKFGTIEKDYITLNEAIEQISKEAGKSVGTLEITINGDAVMEKNTTIPANFNQIIFKTRTFAEGETKVPISLDATGFTLTANAPITFDDTDDFSVWGTLNAKGFNFNNSSARVDNIISSANVSLNSGSNITAGNLTIAKGNSKLTVNNATVLSVEEKVTAPTMELLGGVTDVKDVAGYPNCKLYMKNMPKLFVSGKALFASLEVPHNVINAVELYFAESADVTINDSINLSYDEDSSDKDISIGFFENNPDAPDNDDVKYNDGIKKYIVKDIGNTKRLFNCNASKAFATGALEVALPSYSKGLCSNVYQEKAAVYAGPENIVVKAGNPSGNKQAEEVLESFVLWADAQKYIESLTNSEGYYVVEVGKEVFLNTDLTQPTRAAQVTFRGVGNTETTPGSTPDRVRIVCTGDLKLNSNLAFENIELQTSKVDIYGNRNAYNGNINLNGKTLTLNNSKMSTVNSVASGGTAANNNLVLNKSSITAIGAIDVKGTTTLDTASIDANGKISLNNVITKSAYNSISYGNNNVADILTITGTVTGNDSSDVYAVKNGGEYKLNATEESQSIPVKKNAISIIQKKRLSNETAGITDSKQIYSDGVILVSGSKVAAAYFVVNKDVNVSPITAKSLLRKSADGKSLVYGGIDNAVAKLYVSSTEPASDADYEYLAGFNTYNEAFAEIDRIGIATNYYKVEIREFEIGDSNEEAAAAEMQKESLLRQQALNLPSKTAKLTIASCDDRYKSLFYKGNVTLKSNVEFKNIVLMPLTTTSIALGNFTLILNDSTFARDVNNYSFVKDITGSGTAGKSQLVIKGRLEGGVLKRTLSGIYSKGYNTEENVQEITGNLNNIGTLQLEGAVLSVLGNINIGEIVHETAGAEAILEGNASVTWGTVNGDKKITKLTPNITISGKTNPAYPVEIALSEKKTVNKALVYEPVKFSDTALSYTLLAKVPYLNVTSFKIYGDTSADGDVNTVTISRTDGYITKYQQYLSFVAGNENDAEVILRYENAAGVNESLVCRTFADAVTEINNLANKNGDYTIYVKDTGVNAAYADCSEGITAAPGSIVMPKANCLSTLVIMPENSSATVYYTGDINLTASTTMADVEFVRCDKWTKATNDDYIKNCYYPTNDINPAAVQNIKINNYELRIEQGVTFNVPVNINGGNTSVLTIVDDCSIGENVSAISVNELRVNGKLSVGNWAGLDEGQKPTGNLKVTKLVTYDNADIKVSGNTAITDLKMCGNGPEGLHAKITIESLMNFTITGTIFMANGETEATLITHKTGNQILDGDPEYEKGYKQAASAPYLNISGKLDVSVTWPINVNVKYAYNDIYHTDRDEDAILRIPETASLKNAGKLLTAKNVAASSFVVDSSNIRTGNTADIYDGSNSGYTLLKTGSDMFVYYGSDIKAAVYEKTNAAGELYSAEENESSLVGYYLTLDAAIAAIDAKKANTSDYLIELYLGEKTEGTEENTDENLVILKNVKLPEKARSVAIKGHSTQNTLRYMGTLTAKVPVMFDGIDVEAVGSASLNAAAVSLVNGTNISAENGLITINGDIVHDGTGTIFYRTASSGKPNLTVKGEIKKDNTANPLKLNVELYAGKTLEQNYKLPQTVSGTKITINDNNKLAILEKAPSESVAVDVKDSEGNDIPTQTVKASKGLYAKDNAYGSDETVKLEKYSDAACTTASWTEDNYFLDYSQAIAEINTISDANAYYKIVLSDNYTLKDTVVTDAKYTGALAMPSDNKAAGLVIEGGTESGLNLTAGTVTTFGNVEFKNVKLNVYANGDKPAKVSGSPADGMDAVGAISIVLKQNSNKKLADTSRESVLSFTGNTAVNGTVKSISGIKNVSQVKADGVNISVSESVSNISLDLKNTELTLGSKNSAIDNLNVTCDEGKETVIASRLTAKNLPTLTVNGNVTGQTAYIKLFSASGTELTKEECMDVPDKPIVTALKASADKFMTYQLKGTEGIISYKNPSNYVYCGNLANMQVKLVNGTNVTNDSDVTYTKCYADAISIINNIGDKTADYTIEILNSSFDMNNQAKEIYTGANGAIGAFQLPKAGKSNSVTILGHVDDTEGAMNPYSTIKYTGTMALTTNVTFKDIRVTEGTTGAITPNVGSYTLSFDNEVRTGIEANSAHTAETPDITFTSLSGNGTVKIGNRKVKVNKKMTIGVLDISGTTINMNDESNIKTLRSDGTGTSIIDASKKITLGDVSISAGDIELSYNITPFTKTMPNLTINGSINGQGSGKVILLPKYLGKSLSQDSEMYGKIKVKLDENKTPEAGRTIANIAKGQLEFISVDGMNAGEYLIKHGTGLFISDTAPSIQVLGYATISDFENGTGETFRSFYIDWNQAVAEINKISSNVAGNDNSYIKITLADDIGGTDKAGAYAPISSINMPTKVKKTWIDASYLANPTLNSDDQVNIYTTGQNIVLRSDTKITGVNLSYVKWFRTGINYELSDSPLKINLGNYALEMSRIPNNTRIPSPNHTTENDNYIKVKSSIEISGNAAGSFTYVSGDASVPEGYADDMISKISGVGKAEFKTVSNNKFNYSVKNGISAGELIVPSNVSVFSEKDISVKKASVDNGVIDGANVTISDTLTMNNAVVSAGCINVGNGKLSVNNVVLAGGNNTITGRMDAKGNTQISITGNISTDGVYVPASGEYPIEVGLFSCKSVEKTGSSVSIAKLSPNLTFMNLTKADDIWFVPMYYVQSGRDNCYADMGMGFKNSKYMLKKTGKLLKYTAVSEGDDVYDVFERPSDNTAPELINIDNLEPFEIPEYEDPDNENPKDNEYCIVSCGTDILNSSKIYKVMYPESNRVISGASLKLMTYSNELSQSYNIEKVSDGWYVITNKDNPDLAIEVAGTADGNSGYLRLSAKDTASDNQLFKFYKIKDSGSGQGAPILVIKSKLGTYVSVGGDSLKNNAGIRMTDENNLTDMAKWNLKSPVDSTVSIANATIVCTSNVYLAPSAASYDVYCIDGNGNKKTGWQTISYTCYYDDPAGLDPNKLHVTRSNKYYFDNNGKMLTGWQTIDGKSYYFSEDDFTSQEDPIGTRGWMLTGVVNLKKFGVDAATMTRSGQSYTTAYNPNGTNTYYLLENGGYATGYVKEATNEFGIKDSQKWTLYLAPTSSYPVYYSDTGATRTYNRGEAIGGYTNGDVTSLSGGTVTAAQFSKWYQNYDPTKKADGCIYHFDYETGIRKKTILYYHGGYYGETLERHTEQLDMMMSINKYAHDELRFGADYNDGVDEIVFATLSDSYPLCASSYIEEEKRGNAQFPNGVVIENRIIYNPANDYVKGDSSGITNGRISVTKGTKPVGVQKYTVFDAVRSGTLPYTNERTIKDFDTINTVDENQSYTDYYSPATGAYPDGIVNVFDMEAYLKAGYDLACDLYGAENLVLCGTSSGGAMALSLAMYSVDSKKGTPANTILISPWLDASMNSCNKEDKDQSGNYVDYGTLVYWGNRYTNNSTTSTRNSLTDYSFASPVTSAPGQTRNYNDLGNLTIYTALRDPCRAGSRLLNNAVKTSTGTTLEGGGSYAYEAHGFVFYNTTNAYKAAMEIKRKCGSGL